MTKVAGTSEDHWIHYACALYCDSYEIKDFTTMQITFSQSKPKLSVLIEAQKEAGDKDAGCDLCSSKEGYFLFCLKMKCKKKVHAYCLLTQ